MCHFMCDLRKKDIHNKSKSFTFLCTTFSSSFSFTSYAPLISHIPGTSRLHPLHSSIPSIRRENSPLPCSPLFPFLPSFLTVYQSTTHAARRPVERSRKPHDRGSRERQVFTPKAVPLRAFRSHCRSLVPGEWAFLAVFLFFSVCICVCVFLRFIFFSSRLCFCACLCLRLRLRLFFLFVYVCTSVCLSTWMDGGSNKSFK